MHNSSKYKKRYNYLKNNVKIEPELIEGQNDEQNEGNYICSPNEKFNNICPENNNGNYTTKDKCMNSCVDKYVVTLLRYKPQNHGENEFMKWVVFFYKMIDLKYDSYLKGGIAIGICVLKMISKNNLMDDSMDDFMKLNLMRDWDFMITANESDYKNDIEPLLRKYNLRNEGRTMVVLRTMRKKLEIDESALFESSVRSKENVSDLELPLTSMKILITRKNIKKIFSLSKIFYSHSIDLLNNKSKNESNMDISGIDYLLNYLTILIPKHKNGLFVVDKLEKGGMSDALFKVVTKTVENEKNLQQFLICQMIRPESLFSRLIFKNSDKSKKIKSFMQKYNSKSPEWIFDYGKYELIINKFMDNLKMEVESIFKKNKNDTIKYILAMSEFYENIKLRRLIGIYDKFNDASKKMIKDNMLPKEIPTLLKNELLEVNKKNENFKKNKFLKFIIFLMRK